MAINEAQAVQIENESLALKERSDRITAQINDYVATVNADPDPSSQFVADGKALEAEAVDTLSAVNNFYNSPQVLDGRSDLDYQQRVNESLDAIRDARNQTSSALIDVRSTLATVGTREPADESGTNSAGQIVGADAGNRNEFAVTQNPEEATDPGELAATTSSNADDIETQETLEAQIANADETQTRETIEGQIVNANGTRLRPTPTDLNISRSALIDDSGLTPPTQPTPTRGINDIPVNSGYNQEIKPLDNVLKRFATSTYNITIYLLNTKEYRDLMNFPPPGAINEDITQPIKSVAGLQAILSSGGMPASYDPLSFGGAMRNPNFDLDYFIDDVEIQTLMPQQVRGATNATAINFKITEPYGFTFLTRLKQAAQEHTGNPDWTKAHYLMVIRFFGQEDENSALEEVTTGGGTGDDEPVPLSAKYIPFKFRNITTKAATGAVEYQCDAIPINHLEAMSQKRASVKYQVEVNGKTLNDLFNGNLVESSGPGGVKTVKKGLIESINKYYRDLASPSYVDPTGKKREGQVIRYPDQYEVKFLGGIGNFNIKAPGTTKKNRTGMADPTFPTLLDSSRNQVQKERLTFSVNAGTQIQQFIDLAVRSSEYITKQQRKRIDPNTRKVEDQDSNNFLQWYRITSTSEPTFYDDLRKDYAYNITYYVAPSSVSEVKSSFFPSKPFNGCHKRYNYWFTGENTEILSYEVDFNAIYYVSSSPDVIPDTSTTGVTGVGETTNPGPPDQSILGGSDLSSDPAARAASVLYSPTDYATVRMSILGDPDYIQQGDVFWRSTGVQNDIPGYLPDGSLDYDSGEILFEIYYKTIEDYDEVTGVAKTEPVILKSQEDVENTTTESGTAYKGLIYQVTEVTNKFSKGVFTQDINGVQRYASPVTSPVTARRDPETRPTQTSTTTETPASDKIVIPAVEVIQSKTSTQAAQRITPTLGGLQLAGATYVAPPDDAE